MNIVRRIAAVVVGLLVGGIGVSLVQLISTWLYPMPPDVDMNNTEQLGAWIKTLPTPAFLIVLISWAVGPLLGTFVARVISPSRSALPATIVWLLFAAATLMMLFTIPHPWWMWPGGILVWFLFGMLGLALSAPNQSQVKIVRSINAPIGKVFQTIARPEKFSEAIPEITKIEILSPQKYGVGAKFRETRNMNGRSATADFVVAEQIEDQMIRLVAEMAGSVWDTRFTVTTQGPAVQLEMLMLAQPKNLVSRLVTPMMLGMMEKGIGGDMDRVKDYCEKATKS